MHDKIRKNTETKNFPLNCLKCKRETIINVRDMKITLAENNLMGSAAKIRIILIKRNMKIKDLAEQLGYKQNNFSNKLREDNFSERELFRIAEILDCSYNNTFKMNDTGEEI